MKSFLVTACFVLAFAGALFARHADTFVKRSGELAAGVVQKASVAKSSVKSGLPELLGAVSKAEVDFDTALEAWGLYAKAASFEPLLHKEDQIPTKISQASENTYARGFVRRGSKLLAAMDALKLSINKGGEKTKISEMRDANKELVSYVAAGQYVESVSISRQAINELVEIAGELDEELLYLDHKTSFLIFPIQSPSLEFDRNGVITPESSQALGEHYSQNARKRHERLRDGYRKCRAVERRLLEQLCVINDER